MGLTQSALARSRRHTRDHSGSHEPSHWTVQEDANSNEKNDIWDFNFDRLPALMNWVLQNTLKAMCILSFGSSSLQPIYDVCLGPRAVWQESTDRLYDRLNTMVVVTGLLLSATGAFITTAPPLTNILNYTERGPYLCLLLSWGLALGTVIVGSAVMFIVSRSDPIWFRRTHMGSPFRIVCTMWLIAFPYVCMAASVTMAATGLLVAAWTSQDGLVMKGAVWVLIFPVTCIPVWMYTQYEPGKATNYTADPPDFPMTSSVAVSGGSQTLLPPQHDSTPVPLTIPHLPDHPRINIYIHVQPVAVTSQPPQAAELPPT